MGGSYIAGILKSASGYKRTLAMLQYAVRFTRDSRQHSKFLINLKISRWLREWAFEVSWRHAKVPERGNRWRVSESEKRHKVAFPFGVEYRSVMGTG